MNRRSFFGLFAGALVGTSKPARKFITRLHLDMQLPIRFRPFLGPQYIPIRFRPLASYSFVFHTDEIVPVTVATPAEIELFKRGNLNRL